MIRRISIQEFIDQAGSFPLADVRSPAEFEQGHIPDAFNLPLFSDEERARVGTTYKERGREAAILLGFDLAGPKWSGFIREALEHAPDRRVAVHCWRGGMRSAAMAWALDLYGFQVFVIQGGYKRYRHWALDLFGRDWALLVLGGMTGSGKTRILAELARRGEHVADLESLARHCGSAYGSLGRLSQPTQEQFENDLAFCLHRMGTGRPIWVEDESWSIGQRTVPRAFWLRMQQSPLIEVQVPLESRVDALNSGYGSLDPAFLIECTARIQKRLGGLRAKRAIAAIQDGRMTDFIRETLWYYDKTYLKALAGRDPMSRVVVPVTSGDAFLNAGMVLEAAARLPVFAGSRI